jgi:hypothetical protein
MIHVNLFVCLISKSNVPIIGKMNDVVYSK